jgi:hypothetical protein
MTSWNPGSTYTSSVVGQEGNEVNGIVCGRLSFSFPTQQESALGGATLRISTAGKKPKRKGGLDKSEGSDVNLSCVSVEDQRRLGEEGAFAHDDYRL